VCFHSRNRLWFHSRNRLCFHNRNRLCCHKWNRYTESTRLQTAAYEAFFFICTDCNQGRLSFFLHHTHGRRKDFSREEPIVDFPGVAKRFLQWGPKVAKFYFNHLKIRKQFFLLKIDRKRSNCKIHGFLFPLPFRCPWPTPMFYLTLYRPNFLRSISCVTTKSTDVLLSQVLCLSRKHGQQMSEQWRIHTRRLWVGRSHIGWCQKGLHFFKYPRFSVGV